MSRPLSAVLFDVDGTLYHQARLRLCMAAELAGSLALTASVTRRRVLRVLRMYRRVHEEMRNMADSPVPLSTYQVAATARREGVSDDEVVAIVTEWMQRRPLKYMPWCRRRGLTDLLTRLEAGRVRLGVLSDYPARDKLAALGIAPFFTDVWCSTDPDINALKPHPRGFLQACARWNLQPEEVLYVGDRTEVDAAGALAAGLGCALFARGGSQDAVAQERRFVIRRCDDLHAVVAGHRAGV
jgi:HAD superfamily hydrolase (TIGR01549 family)